MELSAQIGSVEEIIIHFHAYLKRDISCYEMVGFDDD
jgi:hypothetical protein